MTELFPYCNKYHCVVDGGWSSWRRGPCSKSCGGGTRQRTRVCNNPQPDCGGKECHGPIVDVESCNTNIYPGKTFTYICMYM